MSEDSKELANAGSFGMEIHFHDNHCQRTIFIKNLGGMITHLAEALDKQGGMIGHVKLITQTEGGFVKMSVVDTRLGVEIVDELKEEKMKKGTIKLMAVVLGMKDEAVEETILGSLHKLGECMEYHVCGHDCHHDH